VSTNVVVSERERSKFFRGCVFFEVVYFFFAFSIASPSGCRCPWDHAHGRRPFFPLCPDPSDVLFVASFPLPLLCAGSEGQPASLAEPSALYTRLFFFFTFPLFFLVAPKRCLSTGSSFSLGVRKTVKFVRPSRVLFVRSLAVFWRKTDYCQILVCWVRFLKGSLRVAYDTRAFPSSNYLPESHFLLSLTDCYVRPTPLASLNFPLTPSVGHSGLSPSDCRPFPFFPPATS